MARSPSSGDINRLMMMMKLNKIMNSVKLRAAGGPLGVVHEAPGRVPEDLGPILYRQLQREHVLLPIIIHILEPLTIIHTYIPHTLYPRRGSRGFSDIPPRCPRFTKII
jgi:hypothetical protein